MQHKIEITAIDGVNAFATTDGRNNLVRGMPLDDGEQLQVPFLN